MSRFLFFSSEQRSGGSEPGAEGGERLGPSEGPASDCRSREEADGAAGPADEQQQGVCHHAWRTVVAAKRDWHLQSAAGRRSPQVRHQTVFCGCCFSCIAVWQKMYMLTTNLVSRKNTPGIRSCWRVCMLYASCWYFLLMVLNFLLISWHFDGLRLDSRQGSRPASQAKAPSYAKPQMSGGLPAIPQGQATNVSLSQAHSQPF